MEERLEHEVQIAEPQQNGCKPHPVAAAAVETAEAAVFDAATAPNLPPHARELIQRCMDGTEPLEGAKPWHVKKFSPMHVNIAMLRAAGFRGTEIAQITGVEKQLVYHALSHPYTKQINAALVPANGARVIDIRTRIDEYAGELLDQVFDMALQSDDLEEVSKVTFGLLDRAGYGAKPTTPAAGERPAGAVAIVPESTMSKLLSALNGSEQIDREVMPTFVPRRPPEETILGSAGPDVGGRPQPDPVEDSDPRDASLQIPKVASGGSR